MIDSSHLESRPMALKSQNQDEIYVVPAFTGLGAPYWNHMRFCLRISPGEIFNSKEFISNPSQIIAYHVDIIDTMQVDKTSIPVPKSRWGSENDYLMQALCEI